MIMKAILFAALIAIGGAALANPEGQEDFVSHVIAKLELDEKRAGDVRTILKEGKTQRDALKKEARTKMMAHRKALEEQLSELLSNEELRELQKMMRKHHHKKHRRDYEQERT